MQGVVLAVPANPQQGSSPPPNSSNIPAMDESINQSDSGIYSATPNTTVDSDNSTTTTTTEDRKYICPICDKVLTLQHKFTLHIRSHNNNDDDEEESGFVCRICSKVLSSSSSLDRHVLVHSGERPFHCKFCGDTFTTNGNMHRHVRTHLTKSEQYDESDDTTSTDSGRSVEYNNNVNKVKRKLIGDEESSTSSSKRQTLEIKCPVCERSDFNSNDVLESHLEDNHPEYPAKCTQCQQVFANNRLLIVHKETQHQTKVGYRFDELTAIEFSSEKFPQIARRECEKNLYKSAGAFQCLNCTKAFPCAASLEIHSKCCLVTTSSSSPMNLVKTSDSDQIRRNEFFSILNLQDNSPSDKSKPDLADIQSILTNIQKPPQKRIDIDVTNEEDTQDSFAIEFRKMKLRGEFPCRLCTAVFPNLRALKGHNRAHLSGNNNGTYYCNMCPHSSIDKAALIRHMRTHNGDRPYECSLCNYAFTTKANCERHLRNRHSKTTRDDVKKNIIYHPSEDPTNDELNKLAVKEKVHCSTPNKRVLRPFMPAHQTIQVKPFEALKEQSDDDEDDYYEEEEEEEEEENFVLDLSKKKSEEVPQDLTKKPQSIIPPRTVTELVAQQLLKPNAALYASQLADLYRSGFPAWGGFPLSPLLFQALPALQPNPQEFKERMQRFQLCGGSMEENFQPPFLPKPSAPPVPPPPPPLIEKTIDEEKAMDIQSSPTSVKMVIKNGVLMPKQKQRRYRTERPFTCEHCSARFTLRSNMERHIKQQHPQFWSQRQRGGSIGQPGRKPMMKQPTSSFYEHSFEEMQNEKLRFALMAQLGRSDLPKKEEQQQQQQDEDCALVIDEKVEHFEERRNEEDLVPVSRLLVNASQQQFGEYFKRDVMEQEVGSEEDEEGLVASTSEENVSDENRSESETTQTTPVKKKSAYSLAPNRVSCPYCNRKFPWTSSLRRHILTHTGQKPFKCSHCPLLFTTKSNCDRHLLRKHGKAATTIVTNEPTSNNNLNYLMRNVPERPFKCSICPSSTFSTYSNLKKHVSCKHSSQGDDLKAQGYEAGSSEDEKVVVVGGSSSQHQDYDQPINSDLPFKCHLCESSFSERTPGLDHTRDKHPSEYELLMSKNALDVNATTPDENPHNDDEEMTDIRGKFPDYSNRKVICAWCMRRFWSAEDLRRHMRTHTGERPFSCDICRRRFTLKHSMLRHRKKHALNSFEQDVTHSDEEKSCEDGGGDLISKLLGLGDKSIVDKALDGTADDVAKLLGVKNGTN